MLKSSVLIFDKRISPNNDIGADITSTFQDAKKKILASHYSSFVLDTKLATLEESLEIIESAKAQNPDCQIILIDDPAMESVTGKQITTLSHKFHLFKILSQFEQENLFQIIQESFEEHDLKKQNKELLRILKEQNDKLQELSISLEARILGRQRSLLEAKEKLLKANRHFSSIHTALVAIQKAESISDMEKVLVKCLSDSLHVTWVRILFQNQSSLALENHHKSLKHAIFEDNLILEKRSLGKILFAKNSSQKFSKEEIQLLKQISEAISLALDRLIQRERSDFVRQQWQSTFDAITEPVIIINADRELVQFNKSFSLEVRDQFKKKKHCYEQFFNRDKPCEGCVLGKNFSLAHAQTSCGNETLYEVESQPLRTHKNLYVNFYRNKLKQIKSERQILESSKMAELGLIGGSIAHEINNPLAGLITFIQILKQDVESSDTPNPQLLSDLKEMEISALKCRDLIQNLLSFTRKSEDKKKTLSLEDVIKKALRLLQIQADPHGIKIELSIKVENSFLEALENPLTQSLVNILQNALDAVIERKNHDKNFLPLISVELSCDKRNYFIDVVDNGVGLGKNEHLKIFTPFFTTKNQDQHRGLGLTISYQIIKEHVGDIELTQLSKNLTRVRVILPRPVL